MSLHAESTNEEFKEELPNGCPPGHAKNPSEIYAFRALKTDLPTIEDFYSHAAKKKPVPAGVCPCRWASCSFFFSEKATKLPKIKAFPYLARLKISQDAGRYDAGNGHLDLWMYKSFDPISAITGIIARSEDVA